METSDKVELSDAQKLAVLNAWNNAPANKPPSLQEMIDAAFPGQNYDGRTKYGRAVRAFLATRSLRARPAQEYQPKDAIILTEEQKEYIATNCVTMGLLEMAKVLFNNPALTQVHQEARAVIEYAKTLNTKVFYEAPDSTSSDKYIPPKATSRVIAKVNSYVNNANLEESKLTTKQKKDMYSLSGYLHTYRFVHQISSYDKQGDRDLFESSFVRYTWDKNDLTEEEIDQYIILSTEVVISSTIQRHIKDLQKMMDAIIDSDGDDDKKNFKMGLVENMGQARKEYNECVRRQDTMLKNLVGKRSERIKQQHGDTASILNLVQMWKDEESRKKLIHLTEMRKQLVKDEIDRLSTMEEIKVKILGISEDEILNG